MTNQIFPLKLHITQVEETLFSIATKYKVTQDELLSLNPSLRNSKIIFPGSPINVPHVIEEERHAIEEENFFAYNLIDIIYMIKETLLAKIQETDYLKILKDETNNFIKLILEQSKTLKKEKLLEKAYTFFENIFLSLIEFVDILKSKSEENIKNFQIELNELFKNIEQETKEIQSLKSISYFVKNIYKFWQLYILKLLTKNFKDAQEIFYQILQKCKNVQQEKKPSEQ